MNNILLTISYDGTDFCGWQRQADKRTIQQTLEEAIFALTGENVAITGSGRTDAGVHAIGQTANFKTDSTIPPENFFRALNVILPPDVKVLDSRLVEGDFNARRNAKRKTYTYTLYQSVADNPVLDRFASKVYGLDLQRMKEAGKLIVGEHDFKCFQATGSDVKSTVRTVYSLDIIEQDGLVKISVTGSGFLYNMVRLIVGALIKVGQGKAEIEDIKRALESGERGDFNKVMPAKGLCLMQVKYD